LEAGVSTNSADIRGLFEPFLPESQRRSTLGATFDPQAILSLAGDHSRGRLIFFSDSARCRNCHEIDDRAQSVGPTLTEIAKKYQRPQELLQHIVAPSTKMDDPFAAYNVVTTAGVILLGLIQSQTDDHIELKTAERKVVVIPRGEIDVMTRSPQSLMPERLLSDLTAQEAADLLAFLRSPK
jgi:putative heme-binding domain-containing protein